MGLFKSSHKQSGIDGGKTIVAQGCTINGELHVSGSLHVDGHIEGVVHSAQNLSIGQAGQVNGLVQAQIVYLSGCLEGKVECQALEILSTGRFTGELVSGELTIERGGKFVGQSYEQPADASVMEASIGQIESRKIVKE